MIKWPWKTHQPQAETLAQWQEALAIPLLSPLDEQEQQRLIAVAGQILQQKRIVPLQGLVLTSQMQARIALLFALPVLELGAECLDGFNEILLYPTPFVVEDEWQDDFGLGHSGPGGQAGQLPEDAPRFPVTDHSQVVLGTKAAPVIEGLVKTSAAWLIDHAGCGKGFHLPEAGDPPRASLSTKHVLALTNRGGASSADIEALARAVRERVYDAFGVTLVPEPVTVGITW